MYVDDVDDIDDTLTPKSKADLGATTVNKNDVIEPTIHNSLRVHSKIIFVCSARRSSQWYVCYSYALSFLPQWTTTINILLCCDGRFLRFMWYYVL